MAAVVGGDDGSDIHEWKQVLFPEHGVQARAEALHGRRIVFFPIEGDVGIAAFVRREVFVDFCAAGFFGKDVAGDVGDIFAFVVVIFWIGDGGEAVGVTDGGFIHGFAARDKPVAEVVKAVVRATAAHKVSGAPQVAGVGSAVQGVKAVFEGENVLPVKLAEEGGK